MEKTDKLIKEAKEKGYLLGVKIKPSLDYYYGKDNSMIINGDIKYGGYNYLIAMSSNNQWICIYIDGVWAEIDNEFKETEYLNTPDHYDNSKGTLYKIGKERGWHPYLFDIVKRLERAEKKGEFQTDLEKSINVIKLWLNESK